MNCDQGSYAESPTLYAAYVARAAVSDRKLCCGSGAVAPSEWRCRIWVIFGPRTASEPGPFTPQQRTCGDRLGWSEKCQNRKWDQSIQASALASSEAGNANTNT